MFSIQQHSYNKIRCIFAKYSSLSTQKFDERRTGRKCFQKESKFPDELSGYFPVNKTETRGKAAQTSGYYKNSYILRKMEQKIL